MRVGSISNFTFPSAQLSQQKTSQADLSNDIKKTINLEAGVEIDLGTINDKPLSMKILEGGGLEWSGKRRLIKHDGAFTNNDIMALKAFNSYTKTEHGQAENLISVVNDFYMVTKKGYSVDFFNESIHGNSITSGEVEEAIKRMCFTPGEPFTINGRTFEFSAGKLKENK